MCSQLNKMWALIQLGDNAKRESLELSVVEVGGCV